MEILPADLPIPQIWSIQGCLNRVRQYLSEQLGTDLGNPLVKVHAYLKGDPTMDGNENCLHLKITKIKHKQKAKWANEAALKDAGFALDPWRGLGFMVCQTTAKDVLERFRRIGAGRLSRSAGVYLVTG